MKSIDLTQLIKGLLVVIVIAAGVGKFGALQDFARREAAASLRGWPVHAFFPSVYRQVIAAPTVGRVHLKGAARSSSPSHPDQLKRY
jgi:hypothetical protein